MVSCNRSRLWPVRFHALLFCLVPLLTFCAREHEDAGPPRAPDAANQDAVDDDPALSDGIKQIVLSKTEVCTGESVTVDVIPAAEGYVYAIDGMETESRTLQIRSASGATHRVHVDSWPRADRSQIRTRQATIRVKSCDGARVLPVLEANAGWSDPRELKLTVRNSEELDATHYVWDFGDGSPRITTDVPAIDHLYDPRVLSYQHHQSLFDVEVEAIGEEGSVRARKTIALRTHYARRKLASVLQPPVVSRAAWSAGAMRAAVFNPEHESLRLTDYEARYQPCDGKDPVVLARGRLATALQPRDTTQVALALPEPPEAACGLEARLSGRAHDAEVEVSLYAELRPNPARAHAVSGTRARMLDELLARGLVADDVAVSDDALHLLERSGRISSFATDDDVPVLFSTTPTPEQECAPGTLETPPQPGWVCKATGTWIRDEPYLANAHVGDMVLSSSCGEIGLMLRALEVPQMYSHVGIMTQHYDALRHSTALTKRFEDNRAGALGAQGVVPDVLRYALPGTMSSTVEGAYRGVTWRDTRGAGKDYRVSGFSMDAAYCFGDDSVTYPLVVTGTWNGFDQRKAIAQKATTIDSHYRFYAYTRADISTRSAFNMPGTNSVATQCASFLWTAARQAGVTLEGSLEASDIALGAKTESGILDGLYFYSAAERRAAAARMYSAVYNMVSEDSGLKGKIVDAPDNWANQITNCFASDGCDLSDKDSTAWRTVATVGRTVSPSDLLFWDAPYGRSEPLAYRSGTYRKKYVWQPPAGTGTLLIRVVDAQGVLVPNARITAGGRAVEAGGNGQAAIVEDAGMVDVIAQKWIGDTLHTGTTSATIIARSFVLTTVTLGPPDPTQRRIRVDGLLTVHDDEIFGSERATLTIHEDVPMHPGRTTRTLNLSRCAGDEVRADLSLVLTLQPDSSVTMAGTVRLYEGASCETDDREDTKSATMRLPANGSSQSLSIRAVSSGVGGGDWASLSLTASNGQAP